MPSAPTMESSPVAAEGGRRQRPSAPAALGPPLAEHVCKLVQRRGHLADPYRRPSLAVYPTNTSVAA